MSGDTFQVSADGRFAGGLFPGRTPASRNCPNKSWEKIGDGCWTAMATGRGPMFWYFDGSHRNLTMVDSRTKKRWTVPINQAPGFENPEVYHPRWTNHPRFIAMSGPYNQGGANQVRSGGAQTEVWLGRFSEDYSRIEAWTRATSNSGGDSYPDVWIDRAKSVPDAAGRDDRARWRADTRDIDAGRRPRASPWTPGSRTRDRSRRPSRSSPTAMPSSSTSTMWSPSSTANTPEKKIRVAQWAIRDGKVIARRQKSPGAAAKLTVERYDAHPELEGERLITDLGASSLPLYYEVK